jgi:cytosine deaminase
LIAEVGPAGTLGGPGDRLQLSGYLLLPAPADPHAHLDTALLGGTAPNLTGDLAGGVDAWLRRQASVDHEEFERRAVEGVQLAVSHGVTALRSHVGIYEPIGLRAVEALLAVKDRVRDLVDLQLVALTVRLTGPPAAHLLAMTRAALEMGVDVVGGCPHLDPDPERYHELVLSLGSEFERPVDLHTDETVDPSVLYLPHLADLVQRSHFPHGVTAGHCVSLGVQPPEVTERVAQRVADAGMAIVCNPQTNLWLQGRGHATSPPRGLTALRTLLDAGATVAGGSDNLRDPFNPLGRADPLETASLLVTAGHLTVEEAYRAVSAGARAAMGLPEVRVERGHPAELLAVEAGDLAEAIAGGTSRIAIHRGRVVAKTTVSREVLQTESLAGPASGVISQGR